MLRLADLVEGRGRLVHDGDVGRVEEEAGEGETLLLAAGENAVPVVLLVEAADEVGEAAAAQGVGKGTSSETVRSVSG